MHLLLPFLLSDLHIFSLFLNKGEKVLNNKAYALALWSAKGSQD